MPSNDTIYDLSITGQALDSDEGLATLVQVSLLTWARASDEDPVPDPTDLRGWWGDAIADVAGDKFGSKLWIVQRMPATQATLELARRYVLEALQWMIEDGIVEEVTLTLEIQNPPTGGTGPVLAGQVQLKKPGEVAPAFVDLWNIQLASG